MATSHVRWMLAGGVGLAVGLALGGLGPRAENRVLRARVDTLEANARPAGLPAGLSGVLRGEVWRDGDAPRPGPRAPTPRPSPDPGDPEPADAGDDAGSPEVIVVGDEGVDDDDGFDGDTLASAREAMELRQRQAWRALQEQADPTPEEMAVMEAAVDRMNDDLVGIAEAFAASVDAGRPPERRDLMIFAADTLESMIATEDVIAETLGPERAAGVDPEVLDPTAYVDSRVVDVLESVQGFGG